MAVYLLSANLSKQLPFLSFKEVDKSERLFCHSILQASKSPKTQGYRIIFATFGFQKLMSMFSNPDLDQTLQMNHVTKQHWRISLHTVYTLPIYILRCCGLHKSHLVRPSRCFVLFCFVNISGAGIEIYVKIKISM